MQDSSNLKASLLSEPDMSDNAEQENEMKSQPSSSSASDTMNNDFRRVPIGYEPAQAEDYPYVANKITTSKYNVITFVPRSLGEQFRRVANLYFLGISILMIIGTYGSVFDSPLSPFSTLVPLIVVLAITMVKEGLEDLKRHRSDDEVNHRVARVLTPNGEFENTLWANIRVGTILRVHDKEELPADLVLLSSDDEEGLCYVETSNIDGETNLKIRRCPVARVPAAEMAGTTGTVKYESPNKSIHTFQGTVALNDAEEMPLDAANLLLRGSTVRNTRWVLGLVVYTGPDTKIMQNARAAPSKMSKIDTTVNSTVRLIFFTQFILVTASTMVSEIWSSAHNDELQYCCIGDTTIWDPYEGNCETDSDYGVIADWFTFLILYNNFIPISLYVTLEMVNYIQANFINNDLEMYDEEQDTPARARTSNMNADLGQIEYVFSDKTGTLTCNVMNFKRCSIDGVAFGAPTMEVAVGEALTAFESLEELTRRALAEPGSNNAAFLTLMAVCHTVVAETDDDGNVTFQAESPDEGALVQAAEDLGFRFSARNTKHITIVVEGQELTFEVLAINAFNSTRKRMSLICRTPDGRNLLLCKGADNIMFERAAVDNTRDTLKSHLAMFANEGLRTLVLAQRELSDSELESWLQQYHDASVDMNDRDELMAQAAEDIEVNMSVIGATAIEDRLQDGVPDTIATLRAAGIKVWVLTGDKRETAINIGYSCRLLVEGMDIITVAGSSRSEIKNQLQLLTSHFDRLTQDQSLFGSLLGKMRNRLSGHAQAAASGSATGGSSGAAYGAADASAMEEAYPSLATMETDHMALVVEGPSLSFLLGDKECEAMLLQLARFCKSVIACRVSPAQKALIVKLVKQGVTPTPMTLSIGDGANDVSMIQTAQVGVGISGKEGRQAVNSADFAIAQFRFLLPLMLVHGRWDYRRISKVVLYSFYKNIVLTLVLFYYSFYTGFSGESLFESLVYSAYNWVLGMPPLIMGVFDKDLKRETVISTPSVYVSGRLDMDLNVTVMAKWICHALIHSIIIFYIPWAAMNRDGVWAADGHADGINVFGTTVYSCLVLAMLYKCGVQTMSWTFWNFFFFIGSFVFYLLFVLCYSYMLTFAPEFYGVGSTMLGRAAFWLLLLLVPIICIFFDVAMEYFRLQFSPNLIDIAIEQDHGFGDDGESERASLAVHDSAREGGDAAPAEPRKRRPSLDGADTANLQRRDSWLRTPGQSVRVGADHIGQLMDLVSPEDRAEMGINPRDEQRSAFVFDGPSEAYGPGAGGHHGSGSGRLMVQSVPISRREMPVENPARASMRAGLATSPS